jgi:shikimate 5-dehydrogenase
MGGKIKVEKSRMYFIGVTTTQSIINQIFPLWMEVLNYNMGLECVDISMNADANVYRRYVSEIKKSKSILGALVTTHKIPIYENAKDLFDSLEDSSQKFKEIGCIYKRHNDLIGEATDILTVKVAFDNIWVERGYKNTNDVQICVLGCGGAGVALSYVLLSSSYKNIKKIIMVDINSERIEQAKTVLKPFDIDMKLDYHLSTGISYNDNIVNSLTENAFIINATGVGKDLPGSPVSENVCFPKNCCVWEYNYRGDLKLLEIAKQQGKCNNINIYDGFNYFLYGWSTVISRILNITIDSSLFNILAEKAAHICGRNFDGNS